MEDIFKNRFDDWESTPPKGAWKNITQELDGKRRYPFWYWLVGTVLFLFMAGTAFWYFSLSGHTLSGHAPSGDAPLGAMETGREPSIQEPLTNQSITEANSPKNSTVQPRHALSPHSTIPKSTTAKTGHALSHTKPIVPSVKKDKEEATGALSHAMPIVPSVKKDRKEAIDVLSHDTLLTPPTKNDKRESPLNPQALALPELGDWKSHLGLQFNKQEPQKTPPKERYQWQLGLKASASSLQSKNSIHTSEDWYIQNQPKVVSSASVWELGLIASKPLNRKWSLQLALNYALGSYHNDWQAKGRYASEVEVRRSSSYRMTFTPLAYPEKMLKSQNTWQRLGLETGISHQIGQRQALYGSFGLSRVWMKSSELSLASQWSTPITLGYQLKLGKKEQFQLMPFYRYEGMKWLHNSEWIQQKPFSLGVQLSVFF